MNYDMITKSGLSGAKFISSKLDEYEFMRHADCGTGPFRDLSILTEHQRERHYDERRDYSFYLNFIHLAITRLVDPVYKEEPERSFGDDESITDPRLQLFMNDCNKKKQSFSHVIKVQSRKVKRNTIYFCVVDNFSSIEPTEKEALEKRQLPYIYWKSPESVYHTETDEIGRLTSITFKENGIDPEGKAETHYRKWFVGGWVLFRLNSKNEKIELKSATIGINELPVVPIYDIDPDPDYHPVMVQPELYHLAKANVAIVNQSSEIREVERNQGFSLLKIPVSPGNGAKAIKDSVVGTKNAIPYDGSLSGSLDFISPNPDVTRAIMEDRDWILEQIFKLARVVGLNQTKQQSGIAKEWDFIATKEALEHFAGVMQEAEHRIIDLVAKYLKIDNAEYSSNYSENYGIVDTDSEIDLIERDMALDMPESFRKERRKQYVMARIQDPEVRDQIINDIDDMAEDKTHGEEKPDIPPS